MTAASYNVVGELPIERFRFKLRDAEGVGVRLGCFAVKIRSELDDLVEPLHALYCDYPLLPSDAVYSFHIQLASPAPRWRKRRVRVIVDGQVPHDDLPGDQALAALEWGMNLVIALRMQAFLMLHAAALERNGGLLLMPAAPGFGKTTLTVALAHRGWRLLSDEFGMVRPGTVQFLPLPRLMPLKNESIDVIRDFVPNAVIGPRILGTRKGTIAHAKPPSESIRRAAETAQPRWVVFPRYERQSPLLLEKIPKAEAFALLATNAFNYEMSGEKGFGTLRDTIDAALCMRLTYSDLEQGVATLTSLADDRS